MARSEFARDRFDLDPRRRLRRIECPGGDLPVGEKALRHADASDSQRFESLGLEPAADDELRRAAADVDDQTRRGRRREHVRHAEIDQARFFVTADDVDRKAQRALGLRQKLARVFRHPKVLVATARTADGCTPERRSRKRCRHSIAAFIAAGLILPCAVEAGTEAQRLAPGVLAIDLAALDAADLEPEAVRSQIDDGESRGGHAGPADSTSWGR